jgi:hypothetical protein
VGVTTGVVGHAWRATVTPFGGVRPWDGARHLNWYVAADDRWHVPADEPSIRQHRVEGTAVVETRVRVPNGDVVQRVYSVADAGGLTIVEVENDSTLPVAVAFDHRDLRSERPFAAVPVEGIDLPADAVVLPIGHRAVVRVAIAHTGPTTGALGPAPSATQVVRGWTTLTDRASRFVLPGTWAPLGERLVSERCEVALGSMPRGTEDPIRFAVALGELVRLGEQPDEWIPELVDAVEACARDAGWATDVALTAAARVFAAAGERRAIDDVDRIRLRRDPASAPAEPPDDVLVVPWLEQRLATDGQLLPGGFPTEWLGAALEAHHVPVGPSSSVSFAFRWHGERPAVLWEVTGDPVTLTAPAVAPGWHTADVRGEALWPAPRP